MQDIFTSELLVALFALLQNPSTYAWALLLVLGLWVLSKLCTSLAELIKLFK